MKVVITGAAGFMGSHLCDALHKRGHEVLGLDNLSDGNILNTGDGWRFEKCDLATDPESVLLEHMKGVDVLHHYAADATEGRSQFTPAGCTTNNLLAYIRTLSAAIHCGVKRVVVVSSMSVYGDQEPPFDEALERKPVDVYGVNKAAMERCTEILAGVHKFRYVILRPHNIFGERQNLSSPYRNVFGIWINCLLGSKNFFVYGDGEQTRAFSYIGDILPCMIRANHELYANGEAINLGAAQPYTLNEAARILLEVFCDTKVGPAPTFDGCPEWVKPKYLSPRPVEVKTAYSTTEKSKQLLGFDDKTSLREGLTAMVGWARLRGRQDFKYTPLEIVTESTPKLWTEKLV